uniref:major capsid protein n=2 Tax=Yersinia TaxID=629 RepID=UPI000A964396
MLVFNHADGHFNNAAYMAQYRALQEERRIAANAQSNITEGLIQGGMQNSEAYVKNAAGILTRDFWQEVDNQIIQIRDNDQGREFLTDLQSIGTPINPGKTAKLYTVGQDI